MNVGIAIITHLAEKHIANCLRPLKGYKRLVVNSSSSDRTVEIAQEMGAETLIIPRKEFNHGTTRELARKKLNTEIVVMMTPDAYANEKTIETLIKPIEIGKASLAYARQLPHDHADLFESFPRHFNYPAESHIRSIKDKKKHGVYTCFCSDSCAAYLTSALDEVGGFPHVLIGEDTIVASKLLQKGDSIAYVAEATVKHSHRYTLFQEFQRHFDTGLFRRSAAAYIDPFGKDSKRGSEYVQKLLTEVINKSPLKLPYALLHLGAKITGYSLGRIAIKMPVSLKRRLSGQDFYFIN